MAKIEKQVDEICKELRSRKEEIQRLRQAEIGHKAKLKSLSEKNDELARKLEKKRK